MFSRVSAPTPASSRSANAALVILLVAIATNVIVALTLRSKIERVGTASSQMIGQSVVEIRGVDTMKGQQVIPLKGERPTLIYVSRGGCKWCERNVRNLEAIGLQASTRFRILELSPEDAGPSGPQAFGTQRLAVNQDVLRRLGVTGTPYTLLLSPEGRIEKAWVGAFGKTNSASISEALSVQLPGLSLDGRQE